MAAAPSLPALSRSRQDYLKALFVLAQGQESATTSQVSQRLGVSAPSVTKMLTRLATEGLVIHSPRAGARLTAAGRRAALALIRRHRILETFLVRVLELDWALVHEDAEVLEHHISDRVLEALDRLVGHPLYDPHGHSIPDRRGRMPQRDLRPLVEVAAGERAIVREIRDRDGQRMGRWKQAGLVPGARLRIKSVRPLDDVYELEIDGRPLIAGRAALVGVMVDRPSRSRHG